MPACFSKTFYLTFFLLYISCSYAQDFIYRHYDLQDGLASPTIHSIFQDKEGFLWFGTESGLCRYDGTRFKTFTIKDGLPDNEVFRIFEDSKGRLWLQQYKNSIAYIFGGKVYNQQNDTLLKKIKLTSRVHGIAEDNEGNIGICDPETLYIISGKNGTIKTIHSIDGRPINSIALYTDKEGKLTVCAGNALYKIEDDGLKYVKTLYSPQHLLSQNEILLHPDYITHTTFDSVYLKDTTIPIGFRVNNLIKYSPISDTVFSINTTDGAFLFNIHTGKSIKVLPGIKVGTVFLDRERNLWIGTLNKGIYKIGSQAIINKKINNNQDDIFYIAPENNKIIIGTTNAEIYELHQDKLVKRNVYHQWPGYHLYKIFYYEKLNAHNYLLAHGMGLMNYENGVVKNTRLSMLKQASPVDKEHILTASHDGVCIVRKKDLTVTDTIWRRKSLCAFKANGSILIGTISGLFILKESKGRYFITDSLLPSAIISFIKKTENNLIWVCTYENGLYCIKNGKLFRHFTDTSGLPSNNGRSLHAYGNSLWLGTDKGLVKINTDQEHFYLQKYSTSDGLPSNIINSVYADSSMTYIGTPEGLCYFNEKNIETTSFCNLVLTGVRVGNQPVEFSIKYYLNNRQGFNIEFAGISFRSEQEIIYRYKIHGMDDYWHTTTLNALEFTSLPYGDYKLEIIAINKFGKESPPLKIDFHINKPFYKTTWFTALIILLPVFVIVYLYNRRMNIAKQKQVEKLCQEIKILELEQMALRSQMNPHFIFNCISAIQQLVTEGDTDNTHKFVTSFSSLVRQTLDNAPALFIHLQEEIKFLTSYFELQRIRLEDRFSYIINTVAVKNPDQWSIPNMVIQPFVENAIRHGIRYKKNGKGFIEVTFDQRGALLRCTITDNGIGRKKAGQIQQELGMQNTSKGMGLIFKRIESLNTLTKSNISIVIEDLTDENHNTSGTKVIIDFYKIANHHDTYYNH